MIFDERKLYDCLIKTWLSLRTEYVTCVEYRLLPSRSLQRWPAESQVSRRSPNNACTVHCEEYKHPLRSHNSPPTWWKHSSVNAHEKLESKQSLKWSSSSGQREILVYFTDIFLRSAFKMSLCLQAYIFSCSNYFSFYKRNLNSVV